MAAALQIRCQRYQVGAKQTRSSDRKGCFRFMIALTMRTPITDLLIFGYYKWLLYQFDLLVLFHLFFNDLLFFPASRADFQSQAYGRIYLVILEGLAQMLFVSFLRSDFPFPFLFLLFGRFYDVR